MEVAYYLMYNLTKGAEIISNLFREGNIITLSGWWGVGKTPLLKDWSLHIASGRTWCGFATTRRPVLVVDFESDGGDYFTSWLRMCASMGISDPSNVSHYVFNYRGESANTEELVNLCNTTRSLDERFAWLDNKLAISPDSLIIIDPSDMLFPIEKNKGLKVVWLLSRFRILSRKYPKAAFILVFNLRKTDNHSEMPDLFANPRSWLQGTSGSLDIQNRSDIRLGLDEWKEQDDLLVLNGIRRTTKMEPLVIEPLWYDGQDDKGEVVSMPTGFKVVQRSELLPEKVFSPRMLEGWEAMGDDFNVEDLSQVVSLGTAYRLVKRALSFGLLKKVGDEYRKVI